MPTTSQPTIATVATTSGSRPRNGRHRVALPTATTTAMPETTDSQPSVSRRASLAGEATLPIACEASTRNA
jgi:hypothetical protein